MKTTIRLDDQLARRVRRAATEQGFSMDAFVARTLEYALKSRELSGQTPFRLVTVRGSRPQPGVDLDRPRWLDIGEDRIRFGPARA